MRVIKTKLYRSHNLSDRSDKHETWTFKTVRECEKYEREQSGLAMSTAPLPQVFRLCSCIVGSLGITIGKVLGTSLRLRPRLPRIHPKHTELSWSLTWIAWKSMEEGTRILAWVVTTTRYSVALIRTSTDSHSLHAIFTPGPLFITTVT